MYNISLEMYTHFGTLNSSIRMRKELNQNSPAEYEQAATLHSASAQKKD